MEDIQDTPRLTDFLRRMIIESLKLEDLDPAEIREDEPLFGEGLGLIPWMPWNWWWPSKKCFGVVIENEDQGKEAFVSLRALARYIQRRGRVNVRQWVDAEVRVRFEEVDPWQMVWYGRYLSYFEVARAALMKNLNSWRIP